MHHIHQDDLPFRGITHRFEGAEQGEVAISAYLVDAPAGRGSVLHTHPYDTVAFVQEGNGRWTVNGVTRDVSGGDIVVVKAGEAHQFVNTGTGALRILDVHIGPRIIQENL